MRNKPRPAIIAIFSLVVFLFYLINDRIKISQELKIKDKYMELQANEVDWYKNIVSRLDVELTEIKDVKEIDYEKAITLGMLLCAGDGDKGELSHKASFRDKKGVEQVIKNRMLITGRTFYQESTAKFQFSAFNGKGLYIDKYNIPRQAKCVKDAIELVSKKDLVEFNNSTFYHAFNVSPKWARNFDETTRTDLHIFYTGDKGYKSSKTISKKRISSSKVKGGKGEKVEENVKLKIQNITQKIKN